MVHESARAVIDGLARNRRVVGIHDAVDEFDEQPARDQARLPRHDAFQKRVIGTIGVGRFRVVPVDDVIGQPPHALGVVARREKLERADAT